MIFNRWEKHLHPDIELFPLELAGRGHRINIAPYHTLEEAVRDVTVDCKLLTSRADIFFYMKTLKK